MSELSQRAPRLFMATNLLTARVGNRAVMEDLSERLRTRGYRAIAVSRRPNWVERACEQLTSAILRRRQYDVAIVDLYSYDAFLWGETVTRVLSALRCPTVLVLRGGALPRFAQSRPSRVRACLSRAAAVVAPSAYLREQMRPYRSDIVVIPNPLNVAAYEYGHRAQAQPNLVWLRTFRSFYNPVLAPRVLARLKDSLPDLRLTMIGNDDGDGSLQATQKLALELGVGDRIRFAGPVPKSEVPRCLAQGDLFLNTTNTDNTPVSVMEAMASGMCVVSTDVGGMPYLVRDGHNALLVSPDDPEAMARAVRRVIDEPGLAAHLSQNARRTAEEWDWSAILPRWTALLEQIAEARG